jgi:hypothetical protein
MIGIFMVSISTFSQVEEKIVPDNTKQKEKRKFTERIVFGGDIGLSFGTITYIKLAPIIGYQVTSRLTAGLGPIYIYENYKDYHLETSTYGGKVLLSYTLIKNSGKGGSLGIGDIMLHAENEVINVEPLYESYYYGYYFGDRIWIDNLLIGGGLYQPISGRFGVSMFILWDVTQNTYSPYTNPIFKFGFNF